MSVTVAHMVPLALMPARQPASSRCHMMLCSETSEAIHEIYASIVDVVPDRVCVVGWGTSEAERC
jgi:hypothetical protein